MASAGVTRLAKPQMRGILNSQIARNIAVAFALSIVAGASYKILVSDPRKKRVAEYYRTYDANADFERMKKAGVFQSTSG
ncbi:cytochrome c oxidase subunit 6C-like [Hetaerina americana]|uniref:cytochrome c oxidase subunit 6C-like n=1 Tax=Hetaerina americana TaxID=62018 RepID=UPI003A7F1ED6